MMKIKGVGQASFNQYGDHFIAAIAKYVGINGHSPNGVIPGTHNPPATDHSGEGQVEYPGLTRAVGAEVTDEDARLALAAYESAIQAKQEADAARYEALQTIAKWLRNRGIEEATLPGQDRERTVKLVRSTNRSVDYEKLEALVDPETRAAIVTVREREFVRVN